MKKRLYPPFKCSADFPKSIPALLERRRFSVRMGRWLSKTKPNPTSEFGYEVSDGRLTVVVTGGTLPDGVVGYRVVPAMFGVSFKFWLRSKKEEFRVCVQEALKADGGQLWEDYPYD